MVREFRTKKTPFKVWLGVMVVIVALVLMAYHTGNYWHLVPIILPILLLIDELMTKVQIQDNGDVWLKRGFSGYSKAYGVIRIVRGKGTWMRGRITVYYTKGYLNFDPEDIDEFVRCIRQYNPCAQYKEYK